MLRRLITCFAILSGFVAISATASSDVVGAMSLDIELEAAGLNENEGNDQDRCSFEGFAPGQITEKNISTKLKFSSLAVIPVICGVERAHE